MDDKKKKEVGGEEEPIFKKMTGKNNNKDQLDPMDCQNILCEKSNSIDFNFIDNNCFIDNASIETASIDNNFCQDSLSVDNSSLNVSMDLHEASESILDLQEITQSILDLEETQTSRNNSEYGTSTELQGITQVPSSPPPSYEHVLAEATTACSVQDDTNLTESEVPDSSTPSTPPEPKKGIEIIHKTHKEFYRAVAKQWGITCKMSDHCRCLDCQSMYFDCEYDYNEQEKTDGGLGAGTPMFISEVMHGTACTLL
ncbi:conserved hypothetical protein [Pediculus humanus corporis]|uniref:DUF4802 domain-containing protein n=1 Tax=Pediculus humanus subsp. corporis TaxID=121224 RepID=E0VHF4_PEDHC|nr:uncharacterized protein Phum_PHUM207690 [Pediculus humanus corporis]EEB12810.1 conserved hypothetical protein [Pediculus humanus corporis]